MKIRTQTRNPSHHAESLISGVDTSGWIPYLCAMAKSSGSSDRLANRILWGLAIGLVAGVVVRLIWASSPQVLAAAGWLSEKVFDPFGQIFLRLLFFVVIPLVF